MRLLVNIPTPVPSFVLVSVVVGFTDVLQQTPRAVTVTPPSFEILPPLTAEPEVIALAGVVELSIGGPAVGEGSGGFNWSRLPQPKLKSMQQIPIKK